METNDLLPEIDPELFIYELYDSGGPFSLSDAVAMPDVTFGYCDAGRLQVRPRPGEFALMIEWPNGEKCWFHVNQKLLDIVRRRLGRRGQGKV